MLLFLWVQSCLYVVDLMLSWQDILSLLSSFANTLFNQYWYNLSSLNLKTFINIFSGNFTTIPVIYWCIFVLLLSCGSSLCLNLVTDNTPGWMKYVTMKYTWYVISGTTRFSFWQKKRGISKIKQSTSPKEPFSLWLASFSIQHPHYFYVSLVRHNIVSECMYYTIPQLAGVCKHLNAHPHSNFILSIWLHVLALWLYESTVSQLSISFWKLHILSSGGWKKDRAERMHQQ